MSKVDSDVALEASQYIPFAQRLLQLAFNLSNQILYHIATFASAEHLVRR